MHLQGWLLVALLRNGMHFDGIGSLALPALAFSVLPGMLFGVCAGTDPDVFVYKLVAQARPL